MSNPVPAAHMIDAASLRAGREEGMRLVHGTTEHDKKGWFEQRANPP